MLKLKLNCWDLSEWVQIVMKTRQDNDVTNHAGVLYIENNTKLLWPIGPGVVCDEN